MARIVYVMKILPPPIHDFRSIRLKRKHMLQLIRDPRYITLSWNAKRVEDLSVHLANIRNKVS